MACGMIMKETMEGSDRSLIGGISCEFTGRVRQSGWLKGMYRDIAVCSVGQFCDQVQPPG